MEEEFGKERKGNRKVYWKQTSFVACRQKDKNERREKRDRSRENKKKNFNKKDIS